MLERLYRATPLLSSGLALGADGKPAILQLTDVTIIATRRDGRRWMLKPLPYSSTFKLVFKATDVLVKYGGWTRQYRFEGFRAVAQLEATVRAVDSTSPSRPTLRAPAVHESARGSTVQELRRVLAHNNKTI